MGFRDYIDAETGEMLGSFLGTPGAAVGRALGGAADRYLDDEEINGAEMAADVIRSLPVIGGIARGYEEGKTFEDIGKETIANLGMEALGALPLGRLLGFDQLKSLKMDIKAPNAKRYARYLDTEGVSADYAQKRMQGDLDRFEKRYPRFTKYFLEDWLDPELGIEKDIRGQHWNNDNRIQLGLPALITYKEPVLSTIAHEALHGAQNLMGQMTDADWMRYAGPMQRKGFSLKKIQDGWHGSIEAPAYARSEREKLLYQDPNRKFTKAERQHIQEVGLNEAKIRYGFDSQNWRHRPPVDTKRLMNAIHDAKARYKARHAPPLLAADSTRTLDEQLDELKRKYGVRKEAKRRLGFY